MVIVDKEDFEANREGYEQAIALAPTEWSIELTDARTFGSKIREIWPKVRDLSWVSALNDDHKAVTPNWDQRLLKQINGKNIVSCNDRKMAPAKMAGCTIWSMPLLECLGWPIFPPQIEHLGIDDVYEQLGRATGTWRVDMSVVVAHQHCFWGGEMDETHQLTYGTGPWYGSPAQQDVQARMQMFMAQEFQPAVEKIKAFAQTYSYFVKPNPQGAEMHGSQVKK
jgi:hypothetical protein